MKRILWILAIAFPIAGAVFWVLRIDSLRQESFDKQVRLAEQRTRQMKDNADYAKGVCDTTAIIYQGRMNGLWGLNEHPSVFGSTGRIKFGNIIIDCNQ